MKPLAPVIPLTKWRITTQVQDPYRPDHCICLDNHDLCSFVFLCPCPLLGTSLNFTVTCHCSLHIRFPLPGMPFPILGQENANYFFKRQSRGHYLWKSVLGLSWAEVVIPSFCPESPLVMLQLQCLLQKIVIYLPRCPSSKVGIMSYSFSCGIGPENCLIKTLLNGRWHIWNCHELWMNN